MRLGRSVLENVTGLEIFAIIGTLIFFLFFVGVLIWVFKIKAKKIDEYSRMPLEHDDEEVVNEQLNNGNNEKP
jgi:cytochrome c oxidase cbb3-type subunit IV